MFTIKFQFFKEWKFWYKFIIATLIFVAVFYQFIYQLVNPDIIFKQDNDKNFYSQYDYSSLVVHYFSFFTTQSNMLVCGWLFYSAFNHDKEGKKKLLNINFSVAVATYISVTSLIFNFMLLPVEMFKEHSDPKYPGNWSFSNWTCSEILHTIGPIATVVYILLFMNFENHCLSTKLYLKKQFPKILVYPLIYGIYILIRNEIRVASNKPRVTNTPYFFMDVRQNIIWFFLSLMIIVFILISFSILYNFVIKKRLNK
ncbi:Pr6Pr family membrane protein [Spiroplasma endosymbiont of Crioceris asparagi]|uniref:Pr6Pr family membrane protein n=1 Tax=Spiroplasma endosymbiont of Crioceris asparagi TaxID=3066286 RepID=UPI0030CD95CA